MVFGQFFIFISSSFGKIIEKTVNYNNNWSLWQMATSLFLHNTFFFFALFFPLYVYYTHSSPEYFGSVFRRQRRNVCCYYKAIKIVIVSNNHNHLCLVWYFFSSRFPCSKSKTTKKHCQLNYFKRKYVLSIALIKIIFTIHI